MPRRGCGGCRPSGNTAVAGPRRLPPGCRAQDRRCCASRRGRRSRTAVRRPAGCRAWWCRRRSAPPSSRRTARSACPSTTRRRSGSEISMNASGAAKQSAGLVGAADDRSRCRRHDRQSRAARQRHEHPDQAGTLAAAWPWVSVSDQPAREDGLMMHHLAIGAGAEAEPAAETRRLRRLDRSERGEPALQERALAGIAGQLECAGVRSARSVRHRRACAARRRARHAAARTPRAPSPSSSSSGSAASRIAGERDRERAIERDHRRGVRAREQA